MQIHRKIISRVPIHLVQKILNMIYNYGCNFFNILCILWLCLSILQTLSSLKSKNIALIRERDQLTTDLNYLKQVLKDHAHCHVVTRFPVHSQHTTSQQTVMRHKVTQHMHTKDVHMSGQSSHFYMAIQSVCSVPLVIGSEDFSMPCSVFLLRLCQASLHGEYIVYVFVAKFLW